MTAEHPDMGVSFLPAPLREPAHVAGSSYFETEASGWSPFFWGEAFGPSRRPWPRAVLAFQAVGSACGVS